MFGKHLAQCGVGQAGSALVVVGKHVAQCGVAQAGSTLTARASSSPTKLNLFELKTYSAQTARASSSVTARE